MKSWRKYIPMMISEGSAMEKAIKVSLDVGGGSGRFIDGFHGVWYTAYKRSARCRAERGKSCCIYSAERLKIVQKPKNRVNGMAGRAIFSKEVPSGIYDGLAVKVGWFCTGRSDAMRRRAQALYQNGVKDFFAHAE